MDLVYKHFAFVCFVFMELLLYLTYRQGAHELLLYLTYRVGAHDRLNGRQ